MATIQHSLKLIDDLGKIVSNLLEIATNYSALGTITRILPLKTEIQEMVIEAGQVLPELKDLTTAEMNELGLAAYTAFKKIIADTQLKNL